MDGTASVWEDAITDATGTALVQLAQCEPTRVRDQVAGLLGARSRSARLAAAWATATTAPHLSAAELVALWPGLIALLAAPDGPIRDQAAHALLSAALRLDTLASAELRRLTEPLFTDAAWR